MPLNSQSVPLINGVFHLTYTENTGAAFSILQNQRWLFIALTIIFIILATYYLIKHPKEKLIMRVGLSMVLAGAIGNLIDRILLGYVVDFFDFRLINFPVFNIADCAIDVGCALLVIYFLFIAGKKKDIV
jgi:signal peptidase II